MSYTLQLTNGNLLVTVPDQTVDTVTTSLTLIGKNSNAYGTALNDNFVALLENFASGFEPRSPLVGQLWFNTTAGRMYYFTENYQFRPVGSPVVSSVQPSNPVAGDMWIDLTNQQLKYYDGNNFNVAGPFYSAAVGKAGWIVETYTDKSLAQRTVSSLYNNGKLLAILSEIGFTLATPVNGISTVTAGLTLAPNLTFAGTATSASAIAGINASKFIRNDTTGTTLGTLAVLNNGGVTVGALNDIQLYVDPTTGNTLSSNSLGIDFTLQVTSNFLGGNATAIKVKPNTKQVGIWTDTPGADGSGNKYALDIKGDTRIQGNLTVINTATSVQVQNLQVDNKLIELAYPQLQDVNLDGGGIVIHGTTDHSILYRSALNGFEFNNSINIKNPGSLYLDGTQVFAYSGQGLVLQNVTKIPNVNSIGTLTNVQVGNISITTSTINTVDNSNLVLQNASQGNVSLAGKKIIASGPTLISDSTSTLATKGYVDSAQAIVNSSKYIFTVDITGRVNPESYIIANFLNVMLPIVNANPLLTIPDQAEARVNTLNYIIPTLTTNVTFNGQYVNVDKGGVQNSQSVLYGTPGISVSTQPGQSPVCVQKIYRFYVSGQTWLADPANPIG